MSRDPGPPIEPPPPSRGEHVTTLSYKGRFWDVFMEMEDQRRTDLVRALLCFSPSDLNAGEQPARTGTIIVEHSYKEAIDKAKGFDEHQLIGLLRSALP